VIKERFLLAIVIFTSIFFAFPARSACKLLPSSGADQPNGTIIAANFSLTPSAIQIPKDILPGSELYRITARNNKYQYYRVSCDNNNTASNYYVMGQFVGGVAPALSTWQGSSLGTVYQTGTDGIGMVVLTSSANQALGVKRYNFGSCSGYSSCNTTTPNGDITIVLVKTGEITDSSVDLTLLPKLETRVGGNNSPGSDFAVFRPSLTGTLSFTQATCTLAETSKTVDLGEHSVSDFISTPTTAWVDASIRLINCNYGGAQNYSYNIMKYSNSSTVTTVAQPVTTTAAWNLTLTPATSVIDDTNGIMAISASGESATGVGIQLATTNNVTPTLVKFSQTMTGTMVSGSNATMTLPLYARYIKTGTTMTGGKANGRLTYLVEYK
jgi:major type 1 subunit fimbrin (pilin)